MKQVKTCFMFILVLCVMISSIETFAQDTESGGPATQVFTKQSSPANLQVKAQREPGAAITESILPPPSRTNKQQIKTDAETQPQSLEKIAPAWQHLEQLDQADKLNSLISIELFITPSNDITMLKREIEQLWKTGDHSGATIKLREFEKKIGAKNYGVAVSWKTPKIVENPAWGGDVNVTTNDNYWKANFDFHYASNHLLAVGYRTAGTDPRFTVHISYNRGASWAQTWYWWGGDDMADVSGAVIDNYFYVSYVYKPNPTEARIRRFNTGDGTEDNTYFWETVFDKGVNIKEIITVTNQDYFDNRIYVVAILDNNTIVWHYDSPDGAYTWSEIATNVTDADHGLSACYSFTDGSTPWFFISYVTTGDKLTVARSQGSSFFETKNFGGSDARSKTAISGFYGHVMCAYEHFSSTYSRTGIRYYITSDAGNIWYYNDVAEPVSDPYFAPGITARRDCGYSLAYQSEQGTFDPLFYMKRDYDVLNWTTPTKINEVDVFTGSKTSVEFIPDNYGHGVMWINDGTVNQTLYFDKEPDCGITPPPCTITVTSPNGGENIQCSTTITWTSSNCPGNVKIEYYCGGIWKTITSSTPNDGSFFWNIPKPTVCNAKIKVSWVTNPGYWDMSDGYFNINCPLECDVTVTYPNGGGSQVLGCGNNTITWTSSNCTGNMKIEYYCDASWKTIVNSTANDGSYVWDIPQNTVCTNSKVKITNLDNTGSWDMSDNYFKIDCPPIAVCNIEVTNPNGGETIGCNHSIQWNSSNTSGNVKIEYECDGIWHTIISSTPDDGTFIWSIPTNTHCDAIVKISDVANPPCSDVSDNPFRIDCPPGICTPPYVKADDAEGAPDTDFDVLIFMKGNTTPVDAFGFEFNYCADKLTLVDVVKEDLTASFNFFQFQEVTPGAVTIGGFHTTAIPVNSDGVIAKVTLHVKPSCPPGATCALNILNLVDDFLGMNPCLGTFTCTRCKLGDVNNDGTITPGDALCAFQIYLNGGTPPPGTACDNECALAAGDVNCTPNGITPGDALYIFQAYLNGESAPLPCDPSVVAKNFDNLDISVPTINAIPGEEVVYTVELDRAESIQAFGLDLGYPADLLTFIDVRPADLTRNWENLEGKVNVEGVVTIGGFSPLAQENLKSTRLVDVVFRVNENADGMGDIWLFNMTDHLAQSNSRPGQFGTVVNGVRKLGGLETPESYYLEQNYPNPFNMETEITYQLPEDGFVTVTIYNSVGHKIKSLVNQHHSAGKYAARWNGKDELGNDITTGVYIYHIKVNNYTDSKKMLLIK